MKEKTKNNLLKALGIATIIAGSFGVYCLTGIKKDYTFSKPQEYYDSIAYEAAKKNYSFSEFLQ